MAILDIAPLLNRIVIDGNSGCWNYTGPTNAGGYSEGYGMVSIRGRSYYTHRLSYMLEFGPIPDGLVIDHLCRNTLCCNPFHLEPVTHRENMLRGKKAKQTHCIHGHPFDAANTWINSYGHRACKACRASRERARRAQRRENARADG